MAHTSETIINGVLKSFPEQEFTSIKNCTDLNIEDKIKIVNQYILGVSENDKFTGGIDHYKNWMSKRLSGIHL